MENPSNEVVFYICRTSALNWGRGTTIREALRQAQALSSRGKVKKTARHPYSYTRKPQPLKIKLDKCIQTDADLLTDKMLEDYSRQGVILEGFKAGDRMPPFVGNYGQIVGHATKWESNVEIPDELL